jgi:hypothetical protein
MQGRTDDRAAGSDYAASATPIVSVTAAAARARASGWRRFRDERANHAGPPCVPPSGTPMAAMKRCLMNTQSCGGFTVGAIRRL